jgi:tRNA threonylcarbamoyladenosine biosynthesis protein TsaB
VTALDFRRPVLVLEAATSHGTVALLVPAAPLATRVVLMGAGRADELFPAVRDVLAEGSLAPGDLGAVVCGSGPGSFTSLRIAGALAKGLAHGAGRPLYGVSSLLLAAAALPDAAPAGVYAIHADALRGERYLLHIRRLADGSVEPVGAIERLPVGALLERSDSATRVSVGPAPELLPSDWTVLPDGSRLSRALGPWRARPVDLATREPAYGRLAEAQVKWEATHGTSLPSGAA